MLVLSRHVNESIVLHVPPSTEPRDVVVTIVRGGSVRLGFEAPSEINIRRSEVPEQTGRAA